MKKNEIYNKQTLRIDTGSVRYYESNKVPAGQVYVGETHEMARSIIEKHPELNCHCNRCYSRSEIEIIKNGPYTVKHLAAHPETFKKLLELREETLYPITSKLLKEKQADNIAPNVPV